MRRAGRIIYNGGMVVSLLLCLGTVGVWVRSGWVCDYLNWSDWPIDRSYISRKSVYCSRGGLQLTSWHCEGLDLAWLADEHFHHSHKPSTKYPVYDGVTTFPLSSRPRRYAAVGFELVPQANGKLPYPSRSPFVEASLTLPLYFPTLLFALLPAHYFLRVRRRRRIAKRLARGCCLFCGYDLRASAGRCPECGREAAAAK